MAEQKPMPSFMFGDIEVVPLLDGPLASSLDKIPDPAHRAEAEKLIANAGPGAMTMPVYAFLLKFGDKRILIDTGSGKLGYAELGEILERLEQANVSPNDITDILMTHLHRDHYGGLVDKSKSRAAFPRANLIIHEPEAAFWLDSDIEALPARALRIIEEVRDTVALYEGRVRRVGTEEIFPGIRARPSPGHTPGHTCWEVSSAGQTMLAWGDVIHLSCLHLPAPHIAMEYDLNSEMALKTRLAVLDWVTGSNITVAGAHLPEPGVWTIAKDKERWQLRPAIPA